MMGETLGLNLQIDGDITAAKRRIDELAKYADSTLGKSFSRAYSAPTTVSPRSPYPSVMSIGLSASVPRQIESAINRGFQSAIPSLSSAISSAISSALSSVNINVNVTGGGGVGGGGGTTTTVNPTGSRARHSRNMRVISRAADDFIREAKAFSLQDNFFGNTAGLSDLQSRFDQLRSRVQSLAETYRQMDSTSAVGARRRAVELASMYDQLSKIDSLMKRVNKNYQNSQFVYDPVSGTLTQGPSSVEARRMQRINQTEIQRNARSAGVALSRVSGDGTQYIALSDAQAAFNRRRTALDSRPELVPQQQQQSFLGGIGSYLGFGQSGMANRPGQSRATAYGYQSGLFRDRAVGGLFTLQQAVEDYSYAGLRGAANNIAFMAASIGGPAGLATVAALGAYQLYELGKSARLWGNAAREAEERTRRLTNSMTEMVGAQIQMRQKGAFAMDEAGPKFMGAFASSGAQSYQSMRSSAITEFVRGKRGLGLVNALALDIQKNPSAYSGIAPGVDKIESSRLAADQAQGDAWRKRRALETLRKYGGQFGGKAWMNSPLAKDPGFRGMLEKVGSEFGSIGGEYVKDVLAGNQGANSLKQIEDEVKKSEDSAKNALRKNEEAIANLGLTAASTAREILSMTGSNAKAADSVEALIRKHQSLNGEYEKQKRILREKAVLEDRTTFQSQGLDLMRQKSRQFMEQAGAPEWMIQRRELGLYERQGSVLYGMANSAGASGDIQGRIKYLKELQQLQMGLAGQSDNRFISEKAFSAAIHTQSMIEDSIRKNTEGSQQEYQMIQQMASGLVGIRDLILQMPKIDLGLDRQVQLMNQMGEFMKGWSFKQGRDVNDPFGTTGLNYATGGHIPGYGGGDKVPAMLEQGEFVVRKEAVRALGAEYLHNVVNKAHAQKFASGGYVWDDSRRYTDNQRISRAGTYHSSLGYRDDFAYRGTRRMSNHGLPWYVNGRLKADPVTLSRRAVDEWKEMYGTKTYREKIASSNITPGHAGMFSIPVNGRPVLTGREARKPFVPSVDNFLRVRRIGNVGISESSVFGMRTGSVATGENGYDTFSAFTSRQAQRDAWSSDGIKPLTGRGQHSTLGFGTSGTYSAPGVPLSGRRLALSNQRAQFSFAMQRRRDAYQAEMANRRSLGWRGLKSQRGAFGNYANALFGQGGTPYQGGWGMSYEQMMMAQQMMARQNAVARSISMMGPWANRSFGLWDQGSYGLGGRFGMGAVRGFAKGGFVDPYGGTLVSTDPNILQEGNPWQLQGYIPWANAWNVNDAAFAAQRDRVLAGSLNAAYGGPTDFAGNTLGSFGRFSDGSFKSRYSGGFGSGMGSGGFSSMVRSGGFSSFGKPIGAMTGGYVTGIGAIQKFASGGLVNATQMRDVGKSLAGMGTGSSVHNNFGNVTIRVETPRDAMDTVNGMRRSQASFWARRG